MFQRLKSTGAISHVIKQGEAAGTKQLVVYVANPIQTGEDFTSHHRFAVVASRRIGNAVKRNRAKRRLRSVINLLDSDQLSEPFRDYVIIAKAPILSSSYDSLISDFLYSFNRANKRLKVKLND